MSRLIDTEHFFLEHPKRLLMPQVAFPQFYLSTGILQTLPTNHTGRDDVERYDCSASATDGNPI